MNKIIPNKESPISMVSNSLANIAEQRKKYSQYDAKAPSFTENFINYNKKLSIISIILIILIILIIKNILIHYC